MTDASVSREVPPSLAHMGQLAYMALTQAVKGYYIRKFGWQ